MTLALTSQMLAWGRRLAGAGAALVSLLPLWVQWQLRAGLPYDDAFITFVYARSVAAGQGFVYNAGAPHLGTTTPLETLFLAAVQRLLPHSEMYLMAGWLGALLWAAVIGLLYRLGRRLIGPLTGFALAALAATTPLYPYIMPGEYPLLLFCCLLGLDLAMSNRQVWAGVALGLAFLTRADAALLAAAIGLLLLARQRRWPWRLALAFGLIVLPWSLYAAWQFGSPLTATFSLKQAHRAIGIWPPLYLGVWRWFLASAPWHQAWMIITVAAGLIGVAALWRWRQPWALLIPAWGLLYSVTYLWLDVPFRFWYMAPLFLTLVVCAGLGLARWAQTIPPTARWRRLGLATLVLLAAAPCITGWQTVGRAGGVVGLGQPPTKYGAYVEAGRWLAANTPPTSTVGFIEIGLVGYYSQREIIDFLGHATPGVETFLLRRDHAGILATYQPDYYLRNTNFDDWPINQTVHNSDFFRQHYTPIAQISQRDAQPLVIYQRR